MVNQNEWLYELRKSIVGIWRNDDMTLIFSWDGVNDGSLSISSNYRSEAYGANYRILIKEGLPHLLIIAKSEVAPSIQEFLIVKLDPITDRRLVFSSVGGGSLPVGLDRVD